MNNADNTASRLHLFFTRIRALLYKNYLLIRRDRRSFLTSIIVPLVLTVSISFNLIAQNAIATTNNAEFFALSTIFKQYSGTTSSDMFQMPSLEQKKLLQEIVIVDETDQPELMHGIVKATREDIYYAITTRNFTSVDKLDQYLIAPTTCCVLAGFIFHKVLYFHY